MDVNMSEQEQIDALKGWWKKYGNFTIFVVVFALLGNVGWNYYQKRRHMHSEYASKMYTTMLNSYVKNNTSEFKTKAKYLTKNFPDVPYSNFANFALAKEFVKQGKLDEALNKLNDVIEHGRTKRLVQIARIRKARVLLAQDKTADALAVLQDVDEKSFMPLINEVRGDIYVAKGDRTKARTEYQAALKALPMGEVNRSLLQMKFDQIAAPENGLV